MHLFSHIQRGAHIGHNLAWFLYRITLRFPPLLRHVHVKITRHVFHDQKDVGGSGYDLIQFNDVRMTKEFHIFDFSSDFGDAILRLDSLSVDHLHGHIVTGQRVLSLLHL